MMRRGTIAAAAVAVSASLPMPGDGMPAAARASVESPARLCEAVLSAATACAAEADCNGDTASMLSATDRSALVAMERARGFSFPAFERYCTKVCRTRSSQIDVEAFLHDVCGLDATGAPLHGGRKRGNDR